MRTTKPFSTISYNTEQFLTEKLNELVKKRVIKFWAFIEHIPEEDEKKKHKHLYMVPNGQLDTDQLDEFFREIDLEDITRPPLGIKMIVSSKWDDWYLYSCHDSAYLATKGQSRKYHYTQDDFKVSDDDDFTELRHTIDRTKYAKTLDFVEKVKGGASLIDLVMSGQIPVPMFNQFQSMFNLIKHGGTERADRTTHTTVIDEETGEMLGSYKKME